MDEKEKSIAEENRQYLDDYMEYMSRYYGRSPPFQRMQGVEDE